MAKKTGVLEILRINCQAILSSYSSYPRLPPLLSRKHPGIAKARSNHVAGHFLHAVKAKTRSTLLCRGLSCFVYSIRAIAGLFDDLGYYAGTYCSAAFTNSES